MKKKGRRRSKRKSPRRPSRRRWLARTLLLGLIVLLALGLGLYFGHPWAKPEPPPVGRPVANAVELQIALARLGFSPGSIDGSSGTQTRQALEAFQKSRDLPITGQLDEATSKVLRIEDPTHADFQISASAFSKISPPPESWRARGDMPFMGYHSMLEMVAERAAAHPDYIRAINPAVQWDALRPAARVRVPLVPPVRLSEPVGAIHIFLSVRKLQAYGSSGELRFHAPVSIARDVAKRPVGELRVKVRVDGPNYTFNPNILTAAAEREGITEKFIIQPGPNNPVGTVWLGLDRPSYGIHGTPAPEQVGRTESSGCFRLANWNAETLLHATAVGTPVYVHP